mgnify:CR=1 FL=1
MFYLEFIESVIDFVRSGLFILTIIIFIVLIALWKRDRNIVTMIWIFWTFAWIVAWLYDFDTYNMTQSIPWLIEWLKTAFMTSIAWLITAIWLSITDHSEEEDDQKDEEEEFREENTNKLLREVLGELKKMNEKK